MPSLTPAELQEARRRSGRPRKPTRDEARNMALERLIPQALKVLEAHLGDGAPEAWRAALRVFEHAYGRPMEEKPEVAPERDPLDEAHLDALERAVLEQYPHLRLA